MTPSDMQGAGHADASRLLGGFDLADRRRDHTQGVRSVIVSMDKRRLPDPVPFLARISVMHGMEPK